ncbi:MAG: diacylglycerol kinase family lipid kinase [Lachnospiraceae bacterium]|nr:diacylglycerol kinase family lipid kinase [Lachnospiraceae bacterium]
MYHIIINPASRSGLGKQIWTRTIEPALSEKKVAYKAYFSKKPGDVALLAQKITTEYAQSAASENTSSDASASLKEPCRLIILGGDGTVNEALQGIPAHTKVIIGYIPTGSSNDLARDMKISKKPLEALDTILSAEQYPEKIRPMDRGIAKFGNHERSFAVSCGIGFDAAVCAEAMSSKIKDTLNRLKLGKLTYLGIALKQLFAAKPVSCNIYLDEKAPIHIKKILFAATMTHRFEGGGFKFCPTADYTDGIFDLCVVGSIPKPIILCALPTAFFGKHFMFKGVDHYRAKRVRIQTNRPLALHTDGEYLGKFDSLEISCISGDIYFIA